MEVIEFESREALADALAQAVSSDLRDALSVSDQTWALLRVSGGSTPLPFFRALSAQVLDWHRVQLGLVDDRWVDAEHDASNEAFVRRELMAETSLAAKARFVGLADATQSVEVADARWAKMGAEGVADSADALILGMGGDGHFASLFPGMPGLEAALDLRDAPGTLSALAPSEPRERVSLNFAAIAGSKALYLHITGAEKRGLFDRALSGDSDVASLPISHLLAQLGSRLRVYWAP